jgi:glycosyltransferase involved in cell wall biosynthesis
MHICFVTKNDDISRIGINDYGHILPTARHLAKLGHKIRVITWKPLGSEKTFYEEENIYVDFLGVGHFRSVQEFPDLALKKIAEIQKTDPIDIVHSLDTKFKFFKKTFPKKPFALSYGVECTSMMDVFAKFANTYSSDWSALTSMITAVSRFLKSFFFEDYKLLRQADGIFVTSPKQTLALDRYYLFASIRTYQIPLSLASGYFPKKEKNEELMAKLSLDASSQVVVARDSFHDLKQTEFLLNAFEKVAIKKPKAKLLIIGDGTHFKAAERICLELALDNRVTFLGKISKKSYLEYINLGDIFIQLSGHTSGLGIALLEAMSQEKIVIGSEFSPISNFITDHENGLLIRPGESEYLTNYIIDIFENPSNYLEFGQQARNKVIETLDRKKLAQSTAQAFESIIQRTKRKFI